MSTAYVTTSWDDGHVLDLRLADRLAAHGLPGTFYVAPRNVELPARDRLGPGGIRELAARFEVGGHTLTHLRLARLAPEAARQEIAGGKDALEAITGLPVTSFCYPGGAYGPEHPPMVAQTGFTTARTVRRWVTRPTAMLEMATTIHAYRHLVDGPPILRLTRGDLLLAARLYARWDELAIRLFDRVAESGGIFHFWGHSWEIERNGDWGRLERVLGHIAGLGGVEYVSNTELAVSAYA
jgi:peptidoglycan/xylan/chitin deacetylase (PgdA/CDA1 family)